MTTFATRLKKARIDKGLSKTELGEAISVHYSQIGRYEEKGASPNADVMTKLANVLGLSVDYLMNGSKNNLADDTLKDKELLNQFKTIEALPDTDKSVVKIFLDAFITKKLIQKLAL
jgi:transcriptional regulator with XRE-family HTH domain